MHASNALVIWVIKIKLIVGKRPLQYLQHKENASTHLKKQNSEISDPRHNQKYIPKLKNNYSVVILFANAPNKSTGRREVSPGVLGLPEGGQQRSCPKGLSCHKGSAHVQYNGLNEIWGKRSNNRSNDYISLFLLGWVYTNIRVNSPQKEG